ncbi:MAG: divergent polysaccharide deacetylase family protein [Rhodobiaceae bacterium]|nr:divergent polysaccharide deacetylase family protein [Rhodobiaceae bacterium]
MPSSSAATSAKRRLLPSMPVGRVNPLAIAAFLVALSYAAVLVWLWASGNPAYVGPLQIIALAPEPDQPVDPLLRPGTADEAGTPSLLDEAASSLPLPLSIEPEAHEQVEPVENIAEAYPQVAEQVDSLPVAPLPGLVAGGPNGPLPIISSSGRRASKAYARPAGLSATTATLPRVALVVGGLGISETATRNAITNLPPEITLSFAPYGRNLQQWIDRAREAGHEVLLELPMEPYDYPANDPGPYTLLTSLNSGDNLDRLSWLMSRFTGYFGVTAYQGAKFTSSKTAMEPVFEALESRGIMYVDSGVSPRSVGPELASTLGLTWAKGNLIVDPTLTPRSIDGALANMEEQARQNGSVVGFGSGFPVTVERIQKWAEGLGDRGLVLVPVSATALGN